MDKPEDLGDDEFHMKSFPPGSDIVVVVKFIDRRGYYMVGVEDGAGELHHFDDGEEMCWGPFAAFPEAEACAKQVENALVEAGGEIESRTSHIN